MSAKGMTLSDIWPRWGEVNEGAVEFDNKQWARHNG